MRYVNIRTFLKSYDQIIKEMRELKEERLIVTRYGTPLFMVVIEF
jgi:hypothetical protein